MATIISIDTPVEYTNILSNLQKEPFEAALNHHENQFFILEHLPVFTLGRNFGQENLPAGLPDIPVVQTNRGGNTTYHAPGQLIIYPIINLIKLKLPLKEYIIRIEQVAIELASEFLLNATRNPINNGVWIDDKKVASLGISVRKGVTMHGIAININLDLTPFDQIVSCGLTGVKMTSFSKELNRNLDMAQIKHTTKRIVQRLFPECFSDA